MKKWIKNKIFNWRIDHGYYKINELVVGGNCGICGKRITNEIFPIDWSWGICENHKHDEKVIS
jgi:hypothetical protein